MLRRKRKEGPLARIMRLVVIARLALRGFRVARRVHRMRRVIFFAAVGAVVAFIVRRRAGRAVPEPTRTYAPRPTPTITPDGPPLDAQGNGSQIQRNLETDS